MRSLFVSLLLASAASAAPTVLAQPIAPVVESTNVFETGLLNASITAPKIVQSGGVVVVDITGTSDGDTQLVFWPDVPDEAVQYDSNGEQVYAWIVTHSEEPVEYVVTIQVASGNQAAASSAVFTVVPRGNSPPPVPPGPSVTKEQVLNWLNSVPKEVREETTINPITGEKILRQQAISQTFLQVGKVVKKLGSIQAAKIMLTTGLKAALGPSAEDWASFVAPVIGVVDSIKDLNEYGRVLDLIGEALQ